MNIHDNYIYKTLVNDILLITKLGDCPNLEFDVAGENVNWETIDKKNGWLLQKYPVDNGYYRILDKKGKRKAWGSERAMKEKFKRLTRAEFLEPGDVIGITRYSCFALYDHYAVYIGNGRVIHFSAENSDFGGKKYIHEASISEFLGHDKEYFVLLFGEKEETPIKIYHSTNNILSEGLVINTLTLANFSDYKLYSSADTVKRAKEVAYQGEKTMAGYNLLFNNCEHFAIWCKTGVAESYQVSHALGALLGENNKQNLKKFLI